MRRDGFGVKHNKALTAMYNQAVISGFKDSCLSPNELIKSQLDALSSCTVHNQSYEKGSRKSYSSPQIND
jgi:hypothetical protein